MMHCGRCGGSRAINGGSRIVNHYRNDLFEGWFCPQCVNTLIDVALMTMVEEELPVAQHDREHVHAAGCDHDRPEFRDA